MGTPEEVESGPVHYVNVSLLIQDMASRRSFLLPLRLVFLESTQTTPSSRDSHAGSHIRHRP